MESALKHAEELKKEVELLNDKLDSVKQKIGAKSCEFTSLEQSKQYVACLEELNSKMGQFQSFYKSEVECWKIAKLTEPNLLLQEKLSTLCDFYLHNNATLSSLASVRQHFSRLISLEDKMAGNNFEQSFGETEISRLKETLHVMKEANERN